MNVHVCITEKLHSLQLILFLRLILLSSSPPSSPPLSLSLSLSLSLVNTQLVNKGIFMVSLLSNKGVLSRRRQTAASTSSIKAKLELAKAVFIEPELPYHWFYLSICILGFLVHEFGFVVLLVGCLHVHVLDNVYQECIKVILCVLTLHVLK